MCDTFRKGYTVCLPDLRNTDLNSEIFLRKLHRAHEALSQSDTNGSSGGLKTLSASFGAKWPYKRTMSAPASIVPRPDIKGNEFIDNCRLGLMELVQLQNQGKKYIIDNILLLY